MRRIGLLQPPVGLVDRAQQLSEIWCFLDRPGAVERRAEHSEFMLREQANRYDAFMIQQPLHGANSISINAPKDPKCLAFRLSIGMAARDAPACPGIEGCSPSPPASPDPNVGSASVVRVVKRSLRCEYRPTARRVRNGIFSLQDFGSVVRAGNDDVPAAPGKREALCSGLSLICKKQQKNVHGCPRVWIRWSTIADSRAAFGSKSPERTASIQPFLDKPAQNGPTCNAMSERSLA